MKHFKSVHEILKFSHSNESYQLLTFCIGAHLSYTPVNVKLLVGWGGGGGIAVGFDCSCLAVVETLDCFSRLSNKFSKTSSDFDHPTNAWQWDI